MPERILLGKDNAGTFCLKVSQPGDSGGVRAPNEPLLFDSTSVRSGMTYAGGNASSTTGINWSATKGQLGFIPLVVSLDDNAGSIETNSGTEQVYSERGNYFETTVTSLTPRAVGSETSGRTAANLKFFVLRLPMQYGKMTDSSLWS